jgi:hypothetical protein
MYNETVIKFGQSNNLQDRVKTHKKTYDNFRLYSAFKVKNKIEIENYIKKHNILKERLRIITINDIGYRELIALDENEFTLENVEQIIKDIIKENEYNIENYNLLLKKNEEMQNKIYKLNNEINDKNILIENLNKEVTDYKTERIKKQHENIERANKRLKEITYTNPDKIKEYRKTAYQNRKNKNLSENNLKISY